MQRRTQSVHAGRCGCLSSDIGIGGDYGGVAVESQPQARAGSVPTSMRPDHGRSRHRWLAVSG
jgi:hypothetical protein